MVQLIEEMRSHAATSTFKRLAQFKAYLLAFIVIVVVIIAASTRKEDINDSPVLEVNYNTYDSVFADLKIGDLVLNHASVFENPTPIKYSDTLTFDTPTSQLEGEMIDKVTNVPEELKFPREKGSLYTVIFLDADAPSRENATASPWLHWLVVNMVGESTDIGLLKTGSTLTSYHAPTPPANSGWHRYCFFLFKQKSKITTEQIEVDLQPIIAQRNNFDLVKYLEIVRSELVGVQMFKTEKNKRKS